MDFDDLLMDKINTPPTPPPPPSPPQPQPPSLLPSPPQQAGTDSPNNTNNNTPSFPQLRIPASKQGESYYIKPIPSGLRGSTIADLMTLCHAHTLQNGFDVVKKAGVKPTARKNGKKAIISSTRYYKWHITCVLGGKPKNTRHLTEEQRKRDKGSLKMGCPSRVWAWAVDREDPDGPWEIRWGDTDPALHNHPPVDVRSLPNHRRRAREVDGVAEAIRDIVVSGVGRKEALERLTALFPDGLFSQKDMANELQKYKLKTKRAAEAEARGTDVTMMGEQGEQGEQGEEGEEGEQGEQEEQEEQEEDMGDVEEDEEEDGPSLQRPASSAPFPPSPRLPQQPQPQQQEQQNTFASQAYW
jgi:hypothetical protein